MPGFGRVGRPRKPLAIAILGIVLLIVGWIVVSRVAASFDGRFESSYASLAEANKDGAITRGWIPEQFLPKTSRSIHEVHDLSPSTEWCAFEFDPTDSQKLLTNLKPVGALPQRVGHVPSPRVSWWPSVLVGDLDVQNVHNSGFDLYVVERPATSLSTAVWLFAIDWSRGRGFFYSR
jgi:hypothetical protein